MIEHSEARSAVIDILGNLADRDFQQRVWVERRGDPDLIENLDEAVADLFDLYLDDKNIERYVGAVLRNSSEAEGIAELAGVLLPLYSSLPPGTSDAAVIAMPEWSNVVETARATLRTFAEE
ncbi:hypothetical protein ACFWF7_14390 [Nocardia sp. NPDC060256]|uniref:SCO4402 family protein n=1 Tax=unclassified Nocardia TaxID=2637762 RepID=UPI00364FCDE9